MTGNNHRTNPSHEIVQVPPSYIVGSSLLPTGGILPTSGESDGIIAIPSRDEMEKMIMVGGNQRHRRLWKQVMREARWGLLACLCTAAFVFGVVFGVLSRNQETSDKQPESETPTSFICFRTSEELQNAVDAYLLDPSNKEGDIAQAYGWPIGQWCVKDIQDFTRLFSSDRNHRAFTFNEDISGWDVSNATTLLGMFSANNTHPHRFNKPLDSWDVSNVENMAFLFLYTNFNQPVNSWNVGKVTEMSFLFAGSIFFNQSLDQWDVSKVTSMSRMFAGASKFNQDLSSWNVTSVTDMSYMFWYALSFSNGGMSRWKVLNVQDMQYMFTRIASSPAVDRWNVGSVTNMGSMFEGVTSFNRDIRGWNVSRVENFRRMFYQASSFNRGLFAWNISSATNMYQMFTAATSFQQNLCDWAPLLKGKSIQVTDMFKNTSCPSQSSPNLTFSPVNPLCMSCK